MTLKSGKVYSDTGAPNNTYGVDGDIYMRLDGLKTTYRKEGAVWVAVGSSLGAIPEFISGTGVPSGLLGADDQYYRNVENQDIYYKGGGIWRAIGNLQGLAFQSLLIQHGIGKDLSTPPNLINSGSLNSCITQGEFHFTNTVADSPFGYGLMKVWRENETYIYQLVQGAGSTGLATRYSGDGGATWTTWRYSFSGGLATTLADGLVRKARLINLETGTPDTWPDSATLLDGFNSYTDGFTLPKWLGAWKIKFGTTIVGDIAPLQTHTTLISGFSTIKAVFVGGVDISSSGGFFTVHRKSFNDSGVTVKFDEGSSGIQDCGYWWLALGFE